MAAKFGVRGGPELAAAFRKLSAAMAPPVRRKARKAALEPVRQAARDMLALNDSVQTGALRDSLEIAEDPGRRNRTILGQKMGKVRGYYPSKYAHLVEFSVRPHYQPRRFGGIMHPGHPGYPFMRPAIDEKAQEAANVYLRMIRDAVLATAASAPKGRRK